MMIKLRPRPEVPLYLTEETVTNKKRELADRVDQGEKLASNDFPSYWLNESVRDPLWEIHKSKCAYCERKREIKRESDVEHYRPKAGITNDPSHPGYWWLAYEWTNYLYSCKPCNETFKGNQFPLLNGSSRAGGPNDCTSSERPVLLNPIDDDPESCISFDWWSGGGMYVKTVGIDEEGRGWNTINILGLNRTSLMEDRAEITSLLETLAVAMILALWGNNQIKIIELADRIRNNTSSGRTFAGFRRAFLKGFGLGNYVAAD